MTRLALICLTLALAWASQSSADELDRDTTTPGTLPVPSNTTISPIIISTTLASSTTTSTTTTTTQATTKSTTKRPADCPQACQCIDKKVQCLDVKLTSFPKLSKSTTYTKFQFRNNSIDTIDFSMLPASMEQLEVSFNNLKGVSAAKEQSKLRILNLTSNSISNISSDFFGNKFPALVLLDLSNNKLKSIHEDAFSRLTELKYLNLSCTQPQTPISEKQFVKNQKLEIVNLKRTNLIEVPTALRGISSIKSLILDQNNMTSLRKSDFINKPNLVSLDVSECLYLTSIDDFAFSELYNLSSLVITNNPRLRHFSKEAFEQPSGSYEMMKRRLTIDLTNNNLTSLPDLTDISSISISKISLDYNPWNCNCELKWLTIIPENRRSLAHCRTPQNFMDLDVNDFFQRFDCDAKESDYHNIVVIVFCMFLIGLAVSIFVQKSDYLKRLLWKDQYGSIYYTKARFPTDTL